MITKLTVELRDMHSGVAPMGIGVPRPRFGWRLTSHRSGARPTAYQLKIFDSEGCVWDSGVVESSVTQGIRPACDFYKLTEHTWRVSVRDDMEAGRME